MFGQLLSSAVKVATLPLDVEEDEETITNLGFALMWLRKRTKPSHTLRGAIDIANHENEFAE